MPREFYRLVAMWFECRLEKSVSASVGELDILSEITLLLRETYGPRPASKSHARRIRELPS